MQKAAEQELENYLSGKRIELVWSQIKLGHYAAGANVALLGFLFVPFVGWHAYLAWVAAMVVAYGVRWWVFRRLREKPRSALVTERTLVFSSAMLGFVINLPAVFFLPQLSPEVGGLYAAIAVGWVAVAVVIIGIQPVAYLLYLVVGLSMVGIGFWQFLPPATAWIATLHLTIAGVMLGFFARTIASNFKDSAEYDLEKDERTQELEVLGAKRAVFVREYAHDLNQPVHGLSLHVGLLRRSEDPDIRAEALDNIHKSVTQIQSMIDGLADQEALELGEVRANIRPERLIPILERVEAIHRSTCESKGLEYRVSCDEDVYVFADASLLDRILSNLVHNAVRYTAEGRVEVFVSRTPDHVEVSVTDTGVGIAKEDLERVTQPFERGRTHEAGPGEREQGQGLGLAFALQCTELMNGKLTIDEPTGTGTTVRVRLPRVSPKRKVAETPQDGAARKQFLLVIDDDPKSISGLSLSLNIENVEHRCFLSLKDAQQTLQQTGFVPSHLVIDFNLGAGPNGIEAIAALRERLGPTPAVLITGEKHISRDDLPGDIGLLLKPFDIEELMGALEPG